MALQPISLYVFLSAVKYRTPMPTIQYRFLSKKQDWVWLAAKAFAFVNPYSQQVEYIIFTNVLLR